MRNLRAINNRVEVFNLSRLSNQERRKKEAHRGVTANIYSKVRDVWRKDGKCQQYGSQVFVKESMEGEKGTERLIKVPFTFQNIDTQRYREIANKIHVHFSQNNENNEQNMLLIVSLEALHVPKKRTLKSD